MPYAFVCQTCRKPEWPVELIAVLGHAPCAICRENKPAFVVDAAVLGDWFECAGCGHIFQRTTPVDVMTAELQKNFGPGFVPEDCFIVCDACWKRGMPIHENTTNVPT